MTTNIPTSLVHHGRFCCIEGVRMLSRLTLEVAVAILFVFALFLGCASKGGAEDVASVKEYWSQIEDSEMRSHIHDTKNFWHDIAILYRESVERGDPEAFRIHLRIRSYADGVIAEGMAEGVDVIQRWPVMSREVIERDERLSQYFGHLLPSDSVPKDK